MRSLVGLLKRMQTKKTLYKFKLRLMEAELKPLSECLSESRQKQLRDLKELNGAIS